MSENEQEVQAGDETYTVDTETGEIVEEPTPEPLEEEPEDEPDEPADLPEGEPTENAGEPTAKTDQELEAIFKRLDKLRKDTATRVGNIFGDEAVNLMECPLCATLAPGFIWPPDVAPLHEEQITAIRLLLNLPVATDYQQSEAFETCPKCAGLGRVRTGSKVQNFEIAECPRCFAKGYVTTGLSLVPPNGNPQEQEADLTTGPSVYGLEPPKVDEGTLAVIESLKDRGYMVIEPLAAPRPAS